MKKEKLLSVYIPTYNRVNLVCSQVTDVINEFLGLDEEDRNKIEIVVADNHSEDDTYNRVKELINNLDVSEEHIRIYRNTSNLGINGNVYKSLEYSNGKYLWIISDDDDLVSGVLKKVISVLENNDVGSIYLNTEQTYRVCDFSYKVVKYSDKECLMEKPKDYILGRFWQRYSRMALTTSCVFKKKYIEMATDRLMIDSKLSYGLFILVHMICACIDNIYFTEDIWIRQIKTDSSWDDIQQDAYTGAALAIMELGEWYTKEEMDLMFKVYEENVRILDRYQREIGLDKVYMDEDYKKCIEIAIRVKPEYKYIYELKSE